MQAQRKVKLGAAVVDIHTSPEGTPPKQVDDQLALTTKPRSGPPLSRDHQPARTSRSEAVSFRAHPSSCVAEEKKKSRSSYPRGPTDTRHDPTSQPEREREEKTTSQFKSLSLSLSSHPLSLLLPFWTSSPPIGAKQRRLPSSGAPPRRENRATAATGTRYIVTSWTKDFIRSSTFVSQPDLFQLEIGKSDLSEEEATQTSFAATGKTSGGVSVNKFRCSTGRPKPDRQLDQSARAPSPNHLPFLVGPTTPLPLYITPTHALAPAMSSPPPPETAAAEASQDGGEVGGGKDYCAFCEMTKQHVTGCVRRLPKRIILVRHGESQGNLDMSAYSTTPDYRIPLTPHGVQQARRAGRGILDVVSSDEPGANWKVYFYVSPYERTRATLREIGAAFPRDRVIGAREECRVREQDFGNFQVEERMRAVKETRERFGRFFFRFPEGESAADVFDRVASFMESLWRDIDNGRLDQSTSCETNLVIVSHGLTSRVFMMKWFKWTVEQFERLNNFDNCEFRVMQLGPGGEYSLLMHHTKEELQAWGLSPEMITDQQWRASANRRSSAEECSTFIATFFDNWTDQPPQDNPQEDDDDDGAKKIKCLDLEE